jgi:hypothetical protein
MLFRNKRTKKTEFKLAQKPFVGGQKRLIDIADTNDSIEDTLALDVPFRFYSENSVSIHPIPHALSH